MGGLPSGEGIIVGLWGRGSSVQMIVGVQAENGIK
jgi:hypothetical protein